MSLASDCRNPASDYRTRIDHRGQIVAQGGMVKDDGAFLTIGELARELGVAQHILRYWETRFPQLRPLQRSGNRRYYRPVDVETARRINTLLNEEGFTMRGAQRILADRNVGAESPAVQTQQEELALNAPVPEDIEGANLSLLITRLSIIRKDLEEALAVR